MFVIDQLDIPWQLVIERYAFHIFLIQLKLTISATAIHLQIHGKVYD